MPIKGTTLKDIILGGQDGLVNVLGLVLGVAAATATTRIVLISGLAGTFAESLSMAAVAYTSGKAARDFYQGKVKKNHNKLAIKRQMKYLVEEYEHPIRDAVIVGVAAIIGSLIPLAPFFFLTVKSAIIVSISVSLVTLFATGAYKAKLTGIGSWEKSGIEMAVIGGLAAVAGFIIGHFLQYI